MLETITRTIAESELREWVIWLLFNVPGLPPILQSLHILTISVIVGTIGITQLRILNIAVIAQDPVDLVQRYERVLKWSLGFALVTGILFVIARPARYFLNPVAGGKFAFLALAILLTVALFSMVRNRRDIDWTIRGLTLTSTLCWIGVIFGGRWIAYVDYLFWDEM